MWYLIYYQMCKSSSEDHTLSDTVDFLVGEESSYRYQGVTDGIMELTIGPIFELKNDEDTYVAENHWLTHHRTKDEFVKRLAKHIDCRSFEELGFVLAGGAIGSILSNTPPRDYDFFIVGLTEEQAIANITKLARKIGVGYIARTPYCITFVYKKVVIQIILRLYSSVAETLHSFDMGPSQLAFYQGQLLTTKLGQYCFDHMCNIPILAAHGPAFEARLSKYYSRGYDLVLPHFPRSCRQELKSTGKVDLPHFLIDGGELAFHTINKKPLSGYDSSHDYQDPRKIDLKNMKAIHEKRYGGLMAIQYLEEDIEDPLSLPVTFTAERLEELVGSYHRTDSISKVMELFGEVCARKLGNLIVDSKITGLVDVNSEFYKVLEDKAKDLMEEIAPYFPPSVIQPVDENIVLATSRTGSPMNYAQWYGLTP